ncbi:MAG: class I SAM-dependent methyltransferase [Planctomycetota bacterium]|nr:MAG: class I SAM-dependent methyltransferase [Planctomycetota bacterium]
MGQADRTNGVPPTCCTTACNPALDEVRQGRRFRFGRNWQAFLRSLTEQRIAAAQRSLAEFVGRERLDGCTLLDVGCGSGLFSLAARRLGAKVHSFDFDADSVACALELRRRFFGDDPEWTIEQGSVLDAEYLAGLPRFDIVYAWGVLHHTGDMWRAVDLVSDRVAPGGLFWLALYNDQGWKSRFWLGVKRLWCGSIAGRAVVWATFVPAFAAAYTLASLLRRRNLFREHKDQRGMSPYRDWIDWLGGLPFEVASPEDVHEFLTDRGFALVRQRLTHRLGNNEFLFRRSG